MFLHICVFYCYLIYLCPLVVFFFFFKQKTAYEMRISDWSSDVCSSDLNAFAEYLDEPITLVEGRRVRGDNARIHIATYPAMLGVYRSYDVGYFDLIVADESHRSVYNVYGDLFRYFDALQVGLTATPVEFVARNTYQLFE